MMDEVGSRSILLGTLTMPRNMRLALLLSLTTAGDWLSGRSSLSASAFAPSRFSAQPPHVYSTRSSDDLSDFASSLEDPPKTWQDDLEEFMNPTTNPAKRQVLLQELLNANQDIRESVQTALKDRKIDPLLTPTGRKLQAGTEAVARQLSSDILPSFPQALVPPAEDLSKVGARVLQALKGQVQSQFQNLQQDLANPSRIPQRLEQQTSTLVQEAGNVLRDTPVGLKEPAYEIVSSTDDYEIRDYQGYKVASTSLRDDSFAANGAAFNSLAAYLFGANRDNKSMAMTTPVTTTLGGEMRFYLAEDKVPEPLASDEGTSVYETDSIVLQDIPKARLAVRRFTGFVTEGEISRQKAQLLTALQLDGVELDVAHGETVGHVVFQYNPPYTIPMVRRNEIAVAVINSDDGEDDPWTDEEDPWLAAAEGSKDQAQ